MWNPLAGMTKVAIAGTIAGGILVSGIAWQGETAVTTTKQALDTMESRLQEAIADNAFLTQQFNSLKSIYQADASQANVTINGLKETREQLQSELAVLQNQIDTDNQTDAEAKAEIQAEVNRLEGELDKANQQIAELETYALDTVQDANNQYTAVDQNQFQVEDLDIASARPWTVTAEASTATNYTQNNIDIMSDESNLLAQEEAFRAMGRNVTIVGITVHNGNLAYIVQPDNTNLLGYTQTVNEIIKSMDNTDVMYYLNESGSLVGTIWEQ